MMSTARAIFDDFALMRARRLERRMTEQEFVAWCTPDTWAEWVDGEVIIMSPIGRAHTRLLMFLLHLVRAFVEENDLGEVFAEPFQVRLAKLRVRRSPDLFFVSAARGHVIQQFHTEGPPDLIVEVVSPESQSRDRRIKFLEYQSAGVREYWLVDSQSGDVEAYRLGKDRKYSLIEPDKGAIRSTVLPGFYLKAGWLRTDPYPKVSTLLRAMNRRRPRRA